MKQIGVDDLTPDVIIFLGNSAFQVNTIYDSEYPWEKFPVRWAVENQLVFVCFDSDKRPVGFLYGMMTNSPFDSSRKVLRSQLIYAKNPIATTRLIKHFIDYGEAHADYIHMNLGKHANLKQSSLEKLGFEQLDVVYRKKV